MQSRVIVCALAAASLGLSSLSFAQGYDRGGRGDHDRQGWQQRGEAQYDGPRGGWQRGEGERRQRGQDRYAGGDRRHWDDRGDRRAQTMQRGYATDYRSWGRQDAPAWGARAGEWQRGGRIPLQYRSRQYVVNDWHQHRLHAPPSGYEWVQVGGSDYVLVAIATGIIAQLLLDQ